MCLKSREHVGKNLNCHKSFRKKLVVDAKNHI